MGDTAINDNATHTTKNLKGWLLRVVFFPTCYLQMSSPAYITYIVRPTKQTMAVNGRSGSRNVMLGWQNIYGNSVTKRDFRQYYVTTLFVSCWYSVSILLWQNCDRDNKNHVVTPVRNRKSHENYGFWHGNVTKKSAQPRLCGCALNTFFIFCFSFFCIFLRLSSTHLP